ncbi:PilZ domain-containing protein [Salipiger sp. 1_MG-2023]|uniref:PilZ domain-containing protein n=1 Tax=Salipiger sp. 1_MG-2023 TaxID=3062665 RepID=UPI0026E21447|nr:PilZ domain-containing protein [Salipiger sp. 1_MG-2023]MDO6584998.1 PilZ domain-containing protein [Salipiger sp. 1_MG-2023]
MQNDQRPSRNRRAVLRIACGIDVIVEFDRGSQMRCRTIDISISGAQLRFKDPPYRRDESLDKLIIPGAGIFSITKRWADGYRVGVRFSGPEEEMRLLSDLVEYLEKMRQDRAEG